MSDQQPTEPTIIEFQSKLDEMAESFIKKHAQSTGILGGEKHDPKDAEGNLVDQRGVPVSSKFIQALSEQETQNAREASWVNQRDVLARIKIRFGSFVDAKSLESPRTVWTGPRFPFHFTWVTDQKKYGTDVLGARNLSQADEQFLDGIRYEGYIRADLRKLERHYVTGEDAVMLQLPRSRRQIETYVRAKMPFPPPLPPHLHNKFGTMMPLVVQVDGSAWIGTQCLYMIDRRAWDEKQRNYSVMANGTNGHAFDASRGVTLEEGSMSGYFDIPID